MKNWLSVTLFLLSLSFSASAQQQSYQLSSHILDIGAGRPAPDVTISLSKQDKNKNWVLLEEKVTDKNGRIGSFLKQDGRDNTGIYKLTFRTSPYFQSQGRKSFYPFIEVVFELTDNEHYHVPITVSPFGYSTYRGN